MSDFDIVFKQFKDNTKPMCELMGCPELVDDFIVDVEINRQSFKSFYEAGQQSKQKEIDDLRETLSVLLESYNAQKSLPMLDEFNRGWVSAYACVALDLEKLVK